MASSSSMCPLLLVVLVVMVPPVRASSHNELRGQVVATSGLFVLPVDAAADSTGNNFFLLAGSAGSSGGSRRLALDAPPALFHIDVASGNVVSLFEGAPLVSPCGIAVTPDDGTLIIADPGADTLFIVSKTKNGFTSSVQPSGFLPAGYSPTGVTAVSGGQVMFTGSFINGSGGVFSAQLNSRSRRTGPRVKPVNTHGISLISPQTIAVTRSGTIYVADRQEDGLVNIVEIQRRSAQVVAFGLRGGKPSGIALSVDDEHLLVSGLDDTGHDQVYIIDLCDGCGYPIMAVNNGIAANTGSAGLHRARKDNTFAWSDSSDGVGRVYRITMTTSRNN